MNEDDNNSNDNEIINSPPHTSLAAKKKLENKILTRLTRAELVERNILTQGESAPSLQAAQRSLIQKRTSSILNKKLEHRPTQDQLRERNILKENAKGLSSSLQMAQQLLIKSQISDTISSSLHSRPSKQQLLEKRIIKEIEIESSLLEENGKEEEEEL